MIGLEESYKQFMDIDWFENCGNENEIIYNFDVCFDSNLSNVVKSINSIDWENIGIDEIGNLTSYLTKHHRDEFAKCWNKDVRYIKQYYMQDIFTKIEFSLSQNEFPLEIIKNIKLQIIYIFMANRFSGYFESVFYQRIFSVYKAGQIPCGWNGIYPEGKIIVF